MKLRARWEGPLPDVGDALRDVGSRVRAAYVITGIKVVQRTFAGSLSAEWVDGKLVRHEQSAQHVTRAVFEVERIPIADIPRGVAVHDWRWDRRDRKPL